MVQDLHNGQDFLKTLTKLVEANLTDENFGVKELAKEMNISRSNLYLKVKSATGKSVSRFIREIRLNKAKELLEESDKTISEIAYEVGFGSPTYFNSCFHEYFGSTPGEMRKVNSLDTKITETNKLKLPRNSRLKLNYRPLLLFAVVVVILSFGTWLIVTQVKDQPTDQPSIVVLPFKNLSNDEANQYFADGITEDILNNLYWITSLRVVSRTSSELLKNKELSVTEIAKRLGVRYILEGSVRKYDDKARVSVQLIDAQKDDHLWSDFYDLYLGDVLDVQDKISLQVANKLKMVLSEKEIRDIERRGTQNARAYDYYLQARFLLHQANSPQRTGFTADGVLNSIPYYEKAIKEDPAFAEAYAGLANANMQLTAWRIVNNASGFLKADEFSLKAIELDEECAEAYAIQGAMNMYLRREIATAGEMYRKSITLNPHFATARQWYAQHLMSTGPLSEARKQVDKALELEPYFWVVKNLDAWIAYFEKDYDSSLKLTRQARSFNPSFPDNMWLFFLNYVKLNKTIEAKDQLKQIVKHCSGNRIDISEVDSAYYSAGISGVFNWMIEINKNHPIWVEGLNGDYFFLAWWYAILNDADKAIYWLEQNLTYKRPNYHYFNLIIYHPDFEFLHNDPRFYEVVKKLGLQDYWPGG